MACEEAARLVLVERGGGGCGEAVGGVGGWHDRQERLLMDSSDSCDLLLKTRQVPPLRRPTVRGEWGKMKTC